MKYLLLILLSVILVSCVTSQKVTTQKQVTAEKNKRGDLVGLANKRLFLKHLITLGLIKKWSLIKQMSLQLMP
jgi:hypothetical protein